jgi:hypothetical protein
MRKSSHTVEAQQVVVAGLLGQLLDLNQGLGELGRLGSRHDEKKADYSFFLGV